MNIKIVMTSSDEINIEYQGMDIRIQNKSPLKNHKQDLNFPQLAMAKNANVDTEMEQAGIAAFYRKEA